ncbi:MAG: hypothetical protein QG551_324 [Patescibacteria group bacterium]|jgi:hypothetical protein|nr:hypothetical protein [Patescibacteria group bacterium]
MANYVELQFRTLVRCDLAGEVEYQELVYPDGDLGDEPLGPGFYKVDIKFGEKPYPNSRIRVDEDDGLNKAVTIIEIPDLGNSPLSKQRLGMFRFSDIEKMEKVEIPQPVLKGG